LLIKLTEKFKKPLPIKSGNQKNFAIYTTNKEAGYKTKIESVVPTNRLNARNTMEDLTTFIGIERLIPLSIMIALRGSTKNSNKKAAIALIAVDKLVARIHILRLQPSTIEGCYRANCKK
jgi:hypothetical protein